LKFQRVIDLAKVLKSRSCFLFGPRATGKSFWIRESLSEIFVVDLLEHHLYLQLLQRPDSIEEIIGDHKVVVIDEIQKIPPLLNEVHRLM
jgi:predicted AAA+ superfamily ATPase